MLCMIPGIQVIKNSSLTMVSAWHGLKPLGTWTIFIDFWQIINTLPPIWPVDRVAGDIRVFFFFSIFYVWDTFILNNYSLFILNWNWTEIFGCWVVVMVVCFVLLSSFCFVLFSKSDSPAYRPPWFHSLGTIGFIYNKNNRTQATFCSSREKRLHSYGIIPKVQN